MQSPATKTSAPLTQIIFEVGQGDITNETTDAIVNGVSPSFDLNWGEKILIIMHQRHSSAGIYLRSYAGLEIIFVLLDRTLMLNGKMNFGNAKTALLYR